MGFEVVVGEIHFSPVHFIHKISMYCSVPGSDWCVSHDDVIKWKHFPRYWPFVRGIHRAPVNSPHKGQWRGALMFSLICAWKNGWVNNREAGDLRRHRVHYDVTVTWYYQQLWGNARSFRNSDQLVLTGGAIYIYMYMYEKSRRGALPHKMEFKNHETCGITQNIKTRTTWSQFQTTFRNTFSSKTIILFWLILYWGPMVLWVQ